MTTHIINSLQYTLPFQWKIHPVQGTNGCRPIFGRHLSPSATFTFLRDSECSCYSSRQNLNLHCFPPLNLNLTTHWRIRHSPADRQSFSSLTSSLTDRQSFNSVQQRSTHCLASSLTDRQSTRQFGGKNSEIEIDSLIWREAIGNRIQLNPSAGRR